MLSITNGRTILNGPLDARAAARTTFQTRGVVRVQGFLDRALLGELLAALDRTPFYERTHEGIGVELCAVPGPVSGALEFLLNDPALLQGIDDLTGCGPIGCFEGRVYRLAPGTGHYDSWHSDVGQDRLVGMSINLGREPFEGGVLQIRRADSPTVVGEIANHTAGDAVLFRIDPAFRHRVGPVTGSVPRTAYAGWFRAQPDFRALLAARLATSSRPPLPPL